MKKFLQVTGWILVVFACFYLFGLGERTPRKNVEGRMDELEDQLYELEESLGERLTEISNDLDEIREEYADPLHEVRSELEDESSERQSADEGMREEIQDLQGSIDELWGILEELHPDAIPVPAALPEFNSTGEEADEDWWNKW